MGKNLVIVESPAKAKTIEGYLGKDFTVRSSYGHVRDLAKKGLSVDVEKNYEPKYEISADKKQVVAELKKLAKEAEMVWLATDEDREGEAISWHLLETLKLHKDKVKRITFNEITKNAVQKAIENPRDVDFDLVNAQQARRILDRLVGFELSPVLWKKVKPSLSAGRVQSVAVRLIVEREREIEGFQAKDSFKVQGEFSKGNDKFKADMVGSLSNHDETVDFLNSCNGKKFKVLEVKKKPAKKTPAAPFTTSTLQQQAGLKLGFSVGRTMSVAQRLYESGKITYMRTDSINLSDTAIEGAKSEIIKSYGADYANPKKYKNKNANAQEAHEAIRPTDFSEHEVGGDNDESRLYDLIWKRTVASQMSDAELERTTIKIGAEGVDKDFSLKGEVILFDGFLKVYMESSMDDEEDEMMADLLPPLKTGDAIEYEKITATQRYTRPPSRYVEPSLVKKLEELGIGRPSTYAPTISTIQKRGYVVKEEREGTPRDYEVLTLTTDIKKEKKTEITGAERNKLSPTDIGIVVTDFLLEHFSKIMDYDFTANVEKKFDEIANGLKEWTEMIDDFYGPFHENIENTLEHSERATGERLLGVDPKSGKNVYARIGRFGPMIQIGEQDDEEKPRFSSLRNNQSITTINLEEAMELFKLPRVVGTYEDKEIKANIGRFGPYVQHDGKFVSLKKDDGDDPMTVDEKRAIELIEQKREEDRKKMINSFDDGNVQVLNGRWGPYIKMGKKNVKIPKGTDAEKLTLEDCLKLAEEAAKAPKKGRKKKAKK